MEGVGWFGELVGGGSRVGGGMGCGGKGRLLKRCSNRTFLGPKDLHMYLCVCVRPDVRLSGCPLYQMFSS